MPFNNSFFKQDHSITPTQERPTFIFNVDTMVGTLAGKITF